MFKLAINKKSPSKIGQPCNENYFLDEEFGKIKLSYTRSNYIRLKVKPDGQIIINLPTEVSIEKAKNFLEQYRSKVELSIKKLNHNKTYKDGDQIGKSHKLSIKTGIRNHIEIKNSLIKVTHKPEATPADTSQLVRNGIAKALRIEAKAYLPRRLSYLAMTHGFKYEKVRFSHAKTRWGSCSSSGTISLNIALMMLPKDLIDYVLLHELTHTIHMNHGVKFWLDLEKVYPRAKISRKLIKRYSPYI